jgi:hypothetical protein
MNELTTLVVIGNDYIGSCKSNNHMITITWINGFIIKIQSTPLDITLIFPLKFVKKGEKKTQL